MSAIEERRFVMQDKERPGRRTRLTAAAGLAALVLGAPQWAAAQEAPSDPDMTEQDTTSDPDISPDPLAEPDMAGEGTATDPDMTEGTTTVPELYEPPTATDAEAAAEAEEEDQAPAYPVATERDEGPGAAVSAGAGVAEFSRSEARSFMNTGANWDVRGVFGTRALVGVEGAYIGNVYEIEEPGDSTMLYGNGLELSGRLNLMRNGMDDRRAGLQPYALAGVAWKNYQLSGDVATAAVDDEDNAFEIPVGAGLAYYFENGIMLDGRFAYRFSFWDNLIQPTGEDTASLDNWNATARLGVEF
jgi:hypothetical protein